MKNLTLLLSFMLVATSSFAGPGKKDRHHEFGEKMRQELKLSDEQLAKMKEIHKERRAAMKETKAKAKEARTAFDAVMANPKSSTEEIRSKYQAMRDARQATKDARFETMLEVRAILKEDQIAKFQQLKADLKGKGKGKWKGHRKG